VKTCNLCHQLKDLSEFYPHKGSRDGYGYTCKTCSRARSLRWNQDNKDRFNENGRRYWRNNREEINTKRRHRNETDDEYHARRAEQRRRYWERNGDRLRAENKAWRESPEGSAWVAQYLARNKDRIRLRYIVRTYGITAEDYLALLHTQGNRCAICRREPERWAVDHDHTCCAGAESCGRCVRGLLCDPCNRGLAGFADNPGSLRSAADYLERFTDEPPLPSPSVP
jgi:hypothetical protein